jgi:glycosyltransferase
MVLPNMPKLVPHSRRLSEYGAALTLLPGEDTPDAVLEACRELLSTPSYRKRSQEVAAEMAALPGPAEVLELLADLKAG